MRIFHIPIILFIVSMLSSSVISQIHRNRIADLINSAGKAGFPIFVIENFKNDPYVNFTLITKGQNPVPIHLRMRNSRRWTGTGPRNYYTFFTDDGLLYTNFPKTSGDTWTLLSGSVYGIRFPNHREQIISLNIDRDRLEDLFRSVSPSEFHRHRWQFELNGSQLSIYLSIYDCYTASEYEIAIPEYVMDKTDQINWTGTNMYDWSFNGEILIAGIYKGPELSALGQGREWGYYQIWKYNLNDKDWIYLNDIYANLLYVNMVIEKNVFVNISNSRTRHQAYLISFLDIESGDFLHTEDLASFPVIGERWAACMVKNYPSGDTELIFYDMDNNWERYSIPISNIPGLMGVQGGFEMYEPPPNGLDGMYENYQGDQ